MRLIPSAVLALSLSQPAMAFAPIKPSNAPTTTSRTSSTTYLSMSSTSASKSKSSTSKSTSTSKTAKPKKTVADRTQAETQSLIEDILKAAIEAGPRAGPARTIQAYKAITRTIQDFIPQANRREPEIFSAPVALRKLFERMGATYIKLGQFVASSPTLFPKEYVVEFQKCLDSTETLEWSIIEKVIQKELGPGKSINSVFANIDQIPLASASIAQVHAATLKTGEDVVIKVQKPSIDESLKADLSFLYVASRLLEFLQPDFERTSLSGIAGDIRSSMLEELDFEKESTNVEEFRVFLKENGLDGVATAPKVYREFTSKKVMVMERLRGVSMLDAEQISKITNSNAEGTIITALNVWTQSVMSMPWFHADVHAGNLLVLDDGRVGFIDFGIVGRVSEKTFKAVSELSTALTDGDYKEMAQALCNMGAADEEVNIDQFAADIEKVMQNLATVQTDVTVTATGDGNILGSLNFDESEVTQVLLDIVDVTENNGLKLPREFGLLVKQSLYFDRYLKILAPNLDVMADTRVSGLGADTSSLPPSRPSRSSDGVIDVEVA
jgi:aarF domain-containing kinase